MLLESLMVVFRAVLALVLLFLSTKVLTKRSLSKLTYFDYLAITTLGTLAGNLAFNVKIRILYFVISMSVVTLIIYLASYASLKSRTLRKYLAGEPTIIIKEGKILENNMSELKYSYDYLIQQLREEGVFDINNVESAVLEPNGELSIQPKAQNRPVTPEELNIKVDNMGLPTEIVIDGELIESSLKSKNLTRQWLENELNKRGVKDIKEVAFAVVATNGKLYIDLYRD